MKKWLILVGMVLILFFGGYFALSFYAVKFIHSRLQQMAGPGLSVAEVKFNPTYLSAKGMRYEDPLSKRKIFLIEEMRVYPALSSLFKGTLNFRKWVIFRPSFFFYRSQEGSLVGPWALPERRGDEKEISDDREKEGKKSISVRIGRLQIREGFIGFEDRKMGEPPAQIELKELDLELKDVQYPFVASHSSIQLKGKIGGRKRDGSIDAEGWVDLKNRDVETSFKVQEIDIKTFEPYYRKRVSAEIEDGQTNMEAKINIKGKMIDAPGRLELYDLHIREGGTVLWIPAKTLVSLLKDKGNRVQIQFRVKGNMNDPQFNLREAFLTRVAVSLAEALGVPIKVVGETMIGGAGKGFEGLIEGLRSIEKMFKRKKEERR